MTSFVRPLGTSASIRPVHRSPGPAGLGRRPTAARNVFRAATFCARSNAVGRSRSTAETAPAAQPSRASSPPRQAQRWNRHVPGVGSKSHAGSPSTQTCFAAGPDAERRWRHLAVGRAAVAGRAVGHPVVALLAALDDAVAALEPAGGGAAVARRGVAVVALFTELLDPVAADGRVRLAGERHPVA